MKYPTHIIDNEDKKATTTFIPDISILDEKLFVTPFTFAFSDNKVMLSLDKQGWWNPQGGHQENGESIFETVIREAYEEAGIIVRDVNFIGAIKFETIEFRSERSKNYPRISFIPIGYSTIVKIDKSWRLRETKARKLVTFSEGKDLLSLRTDNGLMLSIFKHIIKNYTEKI